MNYALLKIKEKIFKFCDLIGHLIVQRHLQYLNYVRVVNVYYFIIIFIASN